MNKIDCCQLKKCSESSKVQELFQLQQQQVQLVKENGCPDKIKEIGQQIINLSNELSPEEGDSFSSILFNKFSCADCGLSKH